MGHHVAGSAMGGMVLLEALVVLAMLLMWMGTLLRKVVIEHHALLPARSAIETGVMPLLVVLRVHASEVLARRGLSWRFGGRRGFRDQLVEQRIEE